MKNGNEEIHPSLQVLSEVSVSNELFDELVKTEQYGRLGFELLKETGVLASIVACSRKGDAVSEILHRDQAICAGLLMRMTKFMQAVAKLSTEHGHGAVIQSMFRPIIECVVNVIFLTKSNDEYLYDRFVVYGLSPERALYDLVSDKVANRGGVLQPIEDRMLTSVKKMCADSGVEIEDINPTYQDWGPPGGFKKRLEEVGFYDGYVGLFRTASHSVHGTWGDLLLHYLSARDNGYIVRREFRSGDTRILLSMCLFSVDAMRAYLSRFIGSAEEIPGFHEALSLLLDKLIKADNSHEVWMQSRQIESIV